jgi:molecular chaperone GrpE
MKVDVTTPEEPQAASAQPGCAAVDPTAEADVLEAEVIEPEAEADGEPAVQPADDAVFSLADVEQARADLQAANERYARLQAEWDNFRKRTAREREEERARAAEALVTKLLPVVDDLERSLDHAAKSAPEGEFGEFVVGVRAVYDKLVDVFDKTGVEAIDPAGTPFDMNEHQAVAHVDDPSLPDGTVRDVYQKGYRMGGRVIRPAMVTVSKGGAPAPAQG